MHILLAAVGKFKSGPERALFEHYAGRCSWKITLTECEIKKPLTPEALKEQEAQKLLAACAKAEHIIALDDGGDEITSMALAAHMRAQRDGGTRTVAFVIGGAEGLHKSVLTRAHRTLSFGRVTWPHLLVRGMLAEQIYRAQSIISGHPYHRE